MTLDSGAQEEWTDEASGYDCTMYRSSLGHLCGYVRLPTEHPLCGIDYGDVDWMRVDILLSVHGGITFSEEEDGKGRLDAGYWYGFDCAHHGDDPAVQDENYVRAECAQLAAQLRALEATNG
mgnify:CR=1 FL=1